MLNHRWRRRQREKEYSSTTKGTKAITEMKQEENTSQRMIARSANIR